MINGETRTVIELTQGKFVLVQGIIGTMAVTKDWDYHERKGSQRIQRNVVNSKGKRDKQTLIRYLLGLEIGDGIRATQVSKDTVEYQGKTCIDYQTANLKTNRKGYELYHQIHADMARMGLK